MRNKIQRNMIFMIVLTLLAAYAFIIGLVYNQTYRIMQQDARQEAAYIKEAINLLGSGYLQEWMTSIRIREYTRLIRKEKYFTTPTALTARMRTTHRGKSQRSARRGRGAWTNECPRL